MNKIDTTCIIKKSGGANMEKFQKLNTLPLGAIKAEGFLKDQLILGKDGISGNLYKLSAPHASAADFINSI